MSEKLTREQIENMRLHWSEMRLSYAPAIVQLCDLALTGLEVQPMSPGHEPGDITLNADQIKFVTHCEKVAEQRGRAAGLAEAVKVVESMETDFGVIYPLQVITALSALTTSDRVSVPREFLRRKVIAWLFWLATGLLFVGHGATGLAGEPLVLYTWVCGVAHGTSVGAILWYRP